MTTLTNGTDVGHWLEVTKGWRVGAFLGESTLGALTDGLTRGSKSSGNADLIRKTVQSRKDALRELGKY